MGNSSMTKTMANEEERILCAAIWVDDGRKHEHQPWNIHSGFVVSGRRHHNCIYTASLIGEHDPAVRAAMTSRDHQGFLTSHDRYVSRASAAVIAREQGQLLVPGLVTEELTSEELY
jgi:hypothetical protein